MALVEVPVPAHVFLFFDSENAQEKRRRGNRDKADHQEPKACALQIRRAYLKHEQDGHDRKNNPDDECEPWLFPGLAGRKYGLNHISI